MRFSFKQGPFGAAAIAQPNALGDVVSTLPLAAAIKAADPLARILFIGRPYSRPLIESSVLVDQYLDTDEVLRRPALLAELGARLFLNPYLSQELGLAARRAGVAIRVGNLRRTKTLLWANRFIVQSSRKAQCHQALLNLGYLRPLGLRMDYSLQELGGMLGLSRVPALVPELRALLDPQRFNLVLHPKSNKNGREWPGRSFDRLVELLPMQRVKLFVTGRANEREQLLAEHVLLHRPEVVDLSGKMDLGQLIAFLARADGMVCSGTGPLHIAAGFGIHALGLFPGRSRSTEVRWHPLGRRAEALSFRTDCEPGPGRCPEPYSGQFCSCMGNITPEQVARHVLGWL